MKKTSIILAILGTITYFYLAHLSLLETPITKTVPCHDRHDNRIEGLTCYQEQIFNPAQMFLAILVGLVTTFAVVLLERLEK